MVGTHLDDLCDNFGQVAPSNSTGIKIIVVGAGFAGLACAIEGRRKGHDVVILERFKELKVLGDMISFGSNAGRVFERWGLHDEIWANCTHHEKLVLHNSQVYDYATHYWEDEDQAGVICNGERFPADMVVGADGVKSNARTLVLGYDDKPKSSGCAIFRAWFDSFAQDMHKNPLTEFLTGGDAMHGWIGPDVHFLASSFKDGRAMSWVIIHKDQADIEGSWSLPGKMEDVLAVVDGWDPRCAAILSKAPSCVDWKLVYRDSLPTWIGKGARLALIGDAAHPFLPTSMQGASQAVEDGVALAVVLQLAGKQNVPLAVRAWEKMRYAAVVQVLNLH